SIHGYLADIPYPSHFFRETMPVWMVSTLTALGRKTPDLTRPYVWLELGCGAGLGVAVAAATNPPGRFIGVDFNREAIAQARGLVQEAGIGNAHFHDMDFDQVLLAEDDQLPPCDFIVAHGLYSWITSDARAVLRRVVARKLKPGGVVYVSYLCHPGSASFDCAYRFLRRIVQGWAGGSTGKARAGMAFLQRMARAGAGYFQDYPDALPGEPILDDARAALLAHDYLNETRDVLHVADVMADFAAADCEYAGSAAPWENIDTASLPGGTLELLEELRCGGADAATLETFKDLARHQMQRYDLYQRLHPDGNVLSDDDRRRALLAQRVRLLLGAPERLATAQGALTLQSRIGPIRLPSVDAAPLLDALRDGPRTYAQLAALPAYAARPGFVNTLLQLLVWRGWLHFLRPPDPLDSLDSGSAQGLNAALSRRPAPFNGPILAVAAIGSAIPSGNLNP
ncbi:MAG: methyltransferase regulatory domain-containing protein, partial [Zoogloeaceae bacterium]|nr:methyltransferase regulatory domain-containing protein [Zoogloeaceae bacterium]